MRNRIIQILLLLSLLLNVVFCVIGARSTPAPAQTPAPPPTKPSTAPLNWSELNERPVIGMLGVPLGTVAEIQATVVDDKTSKADQNVLFLRVTQVNGQDLKGSPTFMFNVRPWAKVAQVPKDLPTENPEEYLDKSVRLSVYETGSFSGIPDKLPKDVGGWSGYAFHVSSYLTVLADR